MEGGDTNSICSTFSKDEDDQVLNDLNDDLLSQRGADTNSTTDSNISDPNDQATAAAIELVKKETKLVRYSKALVFSVLVVVAAACSTCTYMIIQQFEDAKYRAEFREYAKQVIETSQTTAGAIFKTIRHMSTTITSYALDKESEWPYVTIPHYRQREEQVFESAAASYLWYAPLVTADGRAAWEEWSVANQGWIWEDFGSKDNSTPAVDAIGAPLMPIFPNISRMDQLSFQFTTDDVPADVYLPIWQSSPFSTSTVNWNSFDISHVMQGVFNTLHRTRKITFSELAIHPYRKLDPSSRLLAPIFQSFEKDAPIVGTFGLFIKWEKFFYKVLPETAPAMHVVVQTSFDQSATFLVKGTEVEIVDYGDHRDRRYDSLFEMAPFQPAAQILSDHCDYTLAIYPTKQFYDTHHTKYPLYCTLGVLGLFGVTALVFVLYDILVQKRQEKIMLQAVRSSAIVSSLFPEQVRDRLMQGDQNEVLNDTCALSPFASSKLYSDDTGNDSKFIDTKLLGTKPIADLFLHATVMFADLKDFTAWSSVRQPSQVFALLEQIYNSFDVVARRRKIFKVETVGDCYVAACGVPSPNPDNVVVMARFAVECRSRLRGIVQRLEVVLGPDTGDLTMRFGLHSGPVTAGVLRGEKSRFQLFGDTVNTAARMESTGSPNKIQVSPQAAQLLVEKGKQRWLVPRDDPVEVKGKGTMKTSWLEIHKKKRKVGSSVSPAHSLIAGSEEDSIDHGETKATSFVPQQSKRVDRLIDWNVDVLFKQLQRVVGMRGEKAPSKVSKSQRSLQIISESGKTALDEVCEIIALPDQVGKFKSDPSNIDLGEAVITQLQAFVSKVASMYHDNSFHSFDHASHVNQSVSKLLARIVAPDAIDYEDMCYKEKQGAYELHDCTYGITSDPLTSFACSFSALIHDLDHNGVSNAQLVKEGGDVAKMYRNKSVAEQHSVDLAWKLLMEDQFVDLRACIYASQAELDRFRQLVVNSVMATDIVDKELGAARKARWAKAFAKENGDNELAVDESEIDAVNRKATIVIEHIIQASDVSHTMQHWHIYIKWNKKFFFEIRDAFFAGRADNDPADGDSWYKGELGFYDFYIIPLAKKLKQCGVFGVSSDEYLNYALANRAEWEQKGREVVAEYIQQYDQSRNGGAEE